MLPKWCEFWSWSYRKIRSKFGTKQNSCSSLSVSLSYLHIWNCDEISSNFHVYIFQFDWEMSKLQISKMVMNYLARGRRWSYNQDWVCNIFIGLCFKHRIYSHPSGRACAYKAFLCLVMGSSQAWDILLFFVIFLSFSLTARLGFLCFGPTFFPSAYPLITYYTQAHFHFLFSD